MRTADDRPGNEDLLPGGQRAAGGLAAVLPHHGLAGQAPGLSGAVGGADDHGTATVGLDSAALIADGPYARLGPEGELAVHPAEQPDPPDPAAGPGDRMRSPGMPGRPEPGAHAQAPGCRASADCAGRCRGESRGC